MDPIVGSYDYEYTPKSGLNSKFFFFQTTLGGIFEIVGLNNGDHLILGGGGGPPIFIGSPLLGPTITNIITFNSINNKGKLVFDFICNVIAWLAWVLENSIEWIFYFLTHDWFFHVAVMILSLALITFLINNVYPPIGILIKKVKNFGRRRFSRRHYQRSNRFLD